MIVFLLQIQIHTFIYYISTMAYVNRIGLLIYLINILLSLFRMRLLFNQLVKLHYYIIDLLKFLNVLILEKFIKKLKILLKSLKKSNKLFKYFKFKNFNEKFKKKLKKLFKFSLYLIYLIQYFNNIYIFLKINSIFIPCIKSWFNFIYRIYIL